MAYTVHLISCITTKNVEYDEFYTLIKVSLLENMPLNGTSTFA